MIKIRWHRAKSLSGCSYTFASLCIDDGSGAHCSVCLVHVPSSVIMHSVCDTVVLGNTDIGHCCFALTAARISESRIEWAWHFPETQIFTNPLSCCRVVDAWPQLVRISCWSNGRNFFNVMKGLTADNIAFPRSILYSTSATPTLKGSKGRQILVAHSSPQLRQRPDAVYLRFEAVNFDSKHDLPRVRSAFIRPGCVAPDRLPKTHSLKQCLFSYDFDLEDDKHGIFRFVGRGARTCNGLSKLPSPTSPKAWDALLKTAGRRI